LPIVLGLCPTLLIVYEPYVSRSETVAGISGSAFALIIAVGGLPIYLIAKISMRRHNPKALIETS
jgi:hypothetical protein